MSTSTSESITTVTCIAAIGLGRERGARQRVNDVSYTPEELGATVDEDGQVAAVAELASRLGVRAACDALGIAQASYYRRHRTSPAPARPAQAPHRDRAQPRALSATEQQAILDVLHSGRFADMSPTKEWAILLDESRYLGSIATFYRLLRRTGETRERRRQATHPATVKPELIATEPNPV